MIQDPQLLGALKSDDLIREAQQARLAAQLPQTPSRVRRELALACYRLATWLDHHEDQYVPPSQSGPTDWVRGSASV